MANILKGKKIVLGITGSIAAYKACYIIRGLIKRGAEVQVVITPAGKEFITPITLSALTSKPVISEFFAQRDGLGDPDKKFKFLRSMFHSEFLQTLFSAIHPRWSMELGLNWAKHSRLKRVDGKEPDYMGEDKEFLVLYTKEYLKSHPNINYFIYGHRHIELDLMLSATARVTILGDWINYFSYAVFDGENLFLENFIEGETKL